MASTLRDRYEAEMERFQFQNALEQVFKTIQRANKYIDENAPWALAKEPANRVRLATVMYHLLETIRICATLLMPFMPESAALAAAAAIVGTFTHGNISFIIVVASKVLRC